MSKHVWQTIRFKPSTLQLGWEAYTYARNQGTQLCIVDPKLALTFAGYCLERNRQSSGAHVPVYVTSGVDVIGFVVAVGELWQAADYRAHRYSKGTNAPCYAEAAYRCLVQYALKKTEPLTNGSEVLYNLWLAAREGNPCYFAIHDYLLDLGQNDLATVWATVLEASVLEPLPKPYEIEYQYHPSILRSTYETRIPVQSQR